MSQDQTLPQVPAAQVPDGAYLLDVREHDEWQAGHAPEAVHIPLSELAIRYTELARDRELYVICRSGIRSAQAAQALGGVGWQTRNVADGMIGWHAAGRPMTSDAGPPFVA